MPPTVSKSEGLLQWQYNGSSHEFDIEFEETCPVENRSIVSAKIPEKNSARGLPVRGDTRYASHPKAPTRWQSGNMMQSVLNDSSTEGMSMDGNEGWERWQPRGSSRARNQASEARSRIRQ